MRTRTTKLKETRAKLNPVDNESIPNPIPERNSVKLLLLPQDAGSEARVCTLAHPASSKPCRYYWSPVKGLYEFQQIAAPRTACRSWLLIPKHAAQAARSKEKTSSEDLLQTNGDDFIDAASKGQANGAENITTVTSARQDGHTIQAPQMLVATPIDILFIILPALYAQVSNKSKGLFLSLDDLLDAARETSKHLKSILRQDSMRYVTEQRIDTVCDNVEAGDEKMYRLNTDRLLFELIGTAKRVVLQGLPASMEAKFVDKALEMPMMNFKRADGSVSQTTGSVSQKTESQENVSAESQPSTIASESVMSEASAQTDITIPDQPSPASATDEIKDLLRLRTALQFVISSYLPRPLASTINTLISSPACPVDFRPLEDHLAQIAKLRAEALATRSLSDFSRKRSMAEDDEAAEERAEKRRKKEEEEKRQKTGLSRGVRDLKKVDVSGMKKMSDFFGKKPVTKGK
ncbi:MAG: hypothetical protein Q9218_003819 [Villophora microphyllina]